MFEREIRYISDFTLNSIKKLGTFFTLGSLSNAKIHPAILQYISAELDYLIFLDRQRLLQKSLFDYSGPEILKHFNAIAAEIKKNKLIPFEDARRLVQQAVTFNVNFLLRPRWSLKQFVYDTEEYRTAEELKLLLNYSYFYDYYKVFLTRYIERKSITSLSQAEFLEKTNIITQELLTNQFDGIIANSLEDVAVFLNMGDANKTRLPVEVIEVYLRDRKLEHLITRVRQQLSIDPKQKFETDEYKRIILGDDRQLRIFDFESASEFDEPEGGTESAELEPEAKPAINNLSVDIDKFFEEIPAEDFAPQKPEEVTKIEKIFVEEKPTDAADEDIVEPHQDAVEPAMQFQVEPDVEAEAFTELLTEQLALAGECAVSKEPEKSDSLTSNTGTLNLRILEEIRAANESNTVELIPEQSVSVDDELPMHLNQALIDTTELSPGEKSIFDEEILSISLPSADLAGVTPKQETVQQATDFEEPLSENIDAAELESEAELASINEADSLYADDGYSLKEDESIDSIDDIEDEADDELGMELDSLLNEAEDNPADETEEILDEAMQYSAEQVIDNQGSAAEDDYQPKAEEFQTEPEPEPEEIELEASSTTDPSENISDDEDAEETETELFNYFTTKETMRIVGTVFKNDSIDFVNTIERIATCSSFEEAAMILKSVYFAYHVDPLSDREAKLLEDRIKVFFER